MAVILSAAKNLRSCLCRCCCLFFGGIGRSPTALLFLALVFAPLPAPAQGCSQCRETLGQTPIRTQQAYRRAITAMVLAGTTIFTASFIALKRFRS